MMKNGVKYLIGFLVSVFLLTAMILGAQAVYQKRVVTAYDNSIRLIKEGKYAEAVEELKGTNKDIDDDISNVSSSDVKPETRYYKDTWTICLYAMAMQEYSGGGPASVIKQYLDRIPTEYSGEFQSDIEKLKKEVVSLEEEQQNNPEKDDEKNDTQLDNPKDGKADNGARRKIVYGPPVEDYNVAEYSDPEDFYYDNAENFGDYDSAREFYMENHP